MRVLLIKMSSLGDVVHALAPVTDAMQAKPETTFDWVIEEAYADIPKWHSAVGRVIVSPLRRWRKSPVRTIRTGEWSAFRAELRREKYDVVLDAQGLLKSAFVGIQANGPLVGRSTSSAREPAAALLYQRRIQVDLGLSEVEQLRQLFAQALGYPQPRSPADFGIDRQKFQQPRSKRYVIFLHGAAWPSKLWLEDNWRAVGERVRSAGFDVLLPWGSEAERERAIRIAARIGGTALEKLSISELTPMLAGAEFVLGLDTGLTHIAIALGVPTATIYGPSVPVYESVARGELISLCSTSAKKVDTARPTTLPSAAVISAIEPWLARAV